MIRLKCSAVIIIFFIPMKYIYTEPLVKPLDTRNTHIFYISHLFMPVNGSENPEAGSNDLTLNVIESSTIIDKYQFQEKGKQGIIDLETTSLLLNYIRQIDSRTGFKAVVPFYYHGGGFMDHYIERFHKAFPGNGLKNGGREYGGDNEIHIQYQTASGGPDINKSFYGIGDPSLFIKRVLIAGDPGIICSLGIKPEIGEKAFINSGTTDLGISFTADYRPGIFYLYAMAGCSYFFGEGIYNSELEQSRNYMLCSAVGGGVRFFDTFYFSVQFYIHNSLYDTGIKKIDYPTVINSYSLRWEAAKQMTLQFNLDEDPFTYAGTDIAFSLRCEYTF